MEKQLKGYVFRIYPNQNQKQLIDKSFGVSRFIYNHFLEKSKKENKMSTVQYFSLEKQSFVETEKNYCEIRTSKFILTFVLY